MVWKTNDVKKGGLRNMELDANKQQIVDTDVSVFMQISRNKNNMGHIHGIS